MLAFELVKDWPCANPAIAVIDRAEEIYTFGDTARVSRIASVTKLITSWAVLIAWEEGSLQLDSSVGQDGCTIAHLLSHAGGYGFEARMPLIAPEQKRIYSNTGFDLLTKFVESATDMKFNEYLEAAVFKPLAMHNSSLQGSGAKDVWSCVDDLTRFAQEIRQPKLISQETFVKATSTHFSDLAGTIPGIGRFAPCNWGLGLEIRGDKSPHWTAANNSFATFGHFGGTGSFLWHDPLVDISTIALCDHEFGSWALKCWPKLNDAILEEA